MQNFLKFDSNIFLKEMSRKFIHLFANNMKGWSHKLEIWCVEQSGPALKKLNPNIIADSGYDNIWEIFAQRTAAPIKFVFSSFF